MYLSKQPMWNICNTLLPLAKIIVLKVPLNFNVNFFIKKVSVDEVDVYPLEKMQLIIIKRD